MLDAATATWPEVEAATQRGLVAVLAIGAVEQHGPHLSLLTDTIMAQGVARRLASELDALLLPPIAYGDAWTARNFPGTVSLSPDTLRAVIHDIGRSCQAGKIAGLIVVNGHFGNREPIALAARALEVEHGFSTLYLDYPGLGAAAAEICDSAPAGHGFMHADEVETSFILALEPLAAHMERAVAEYPDFPAEFGAVPADLRAISTSGVFSDPRPATAEKGERLIAAVLASSLPLAQAFASRATSSKAG